jgi:hypothetical protein
VNLPLSLISQTMACATSFDSLARCIGADGFCKRLVGLAARRVDVGVDDAKARVDANVFSGYLLGQTHGR